MKIKQTFDADKWEWIKENVDDRDIAAAQVQFAKSPLTMSRYFAKNCKSVNAGVFNFLLKRAEKNSGTVYKSITA